MNKLFKIVAASSFFVLASLSSEVSAQAKCIDEVCAAFLNGEIASLRKEIQKLKGQNGRVSTHNKNKKKVATKKSTQTGGKVCWWVQAKNDAGMSTVIVYAGTYSSRGKVLASFGAAGWKVVNGRRVMNVCVAKKKFKQYKAVAMCNENGHNEFGPADIETVLRRGRVGLDDVAMMSASGGY